MSLSNASADGTGDGTESPSKESKIASLDTGWCGMTWQSRASRAATTPLQVRILYPPHHAKRPVDLGKQATGAFFVCAAVCSPGQPVAAVCPKYAPKFGATRGVAQQPSNARPTRSRAACSPCRGTSRRPAAARPGCRLASAEVRGAGRRLHSASHRQGLCRPSIDRPQRTTRWTSG
jgi:hypothetical protein